MNEFKEFFKKYGVYILVGGVALYLLYKLSNRSSGGSQQSSTVVIPAEGSNADKTALAQLSAQFQLGKLQLQSQSDIANKQIEAEKQRLDYQNQALQIQGNYGLEALKIEAQKVQGQNELQSNLAQIALNQNSYDQQTRANAALELQRQAAQQSYLQQLLGVGNGVLQSLLKSQQQSRQGSSGGGSGGSIGGSPNNAALQNYQRQSALAQLKAYLSGKATQQYYSPVSTSTGAFALGNATGFDLQQFYNNEIQSFDNYLGFNPFGYSPNGVNVNGFGDLNTQPFGGLSIADYFGFSSEQDLLNNYGYGDIGSFLNDYYYSDGG